MDGNRLVDHVRTHWDYKAVALRKVHRHHMSEDTDKPFMGAISCETENDLKELQNLHIQCFPSGDVNTVLPYHWFSYFGTCKFDAMARKRVANEGDCSSSSARTGASRLESSDTASSGNSQNAAAETLFQDCVDDFVEARSHLFSQMDPSGQVSRAVEVHPLPARCMLEDKNHTTLCATRNTTRTQGNHRTALVNREKKTAQSGSFSINSHAMEIEDSEIMMKPRSQIFHFRNKFGEERNQSVRI